MWVADPVDDRKVGNITRNSAEHLLTTVCPVTATTKSKNGQFRFKQNPCAFYRNDCAGHQESACSVD